MIKFIGIGSAFNTKLGNNSSFIKKNKSMILIDCGGTVFHKLKELKLLEDLEELYIVITHTHPDHVGSLGDVIFYVYYILHTRVKIYYPNKDVIIKFLSSIGVSDEMYELHSSFENKIHDNILGKVEVEFLIASHVDTIPAYSFIMSICDLKFYYSGDTNELGTGIINKLMSNEINRIYHDTCGIDFERNPHLTLSRLCMKIPLEFRKKVYCMHLDNSIDISEIKKNGFNVVDLYKLDQLAMKEE